MPVWPISSVTDEPLIMSCWRLFRDPVRGRHHLVGWSGPVGEARVTSAIVSFDPNDKLAIDRSGQAYRLFGPSGSSRDTDNALGQFCRSRGLRIDSLSDESGLVDAPTVDFVSLLAPARVAPWFIHLNGLPGVGAASVGELVAAAFDCQLIDHRKTLRLASNLMGAGETTWRAALAEARSIAIQIAMDHRFDQPLVFTDILWADLPDDKKAIGGLAALAARCDARLLAATLIADEPVRLARLAESDPSIPDDLNTFTRRTLITETTYQNYGVRSVVIDVTHLNSEDAAVEVIRHLIEAPAGA